MENTRATTHRLRRIMGNVYHMRVCAGGSERWGALGLVVWGTRRWGWCAASQVSEARPGAPESPAGLGVVVSHPSDKNKSPTLATKTRTSRGWGTRSLVVVHPSQVSEARPGAPESPAGLGVVVSHPSDKNKDVARVGHPVVGVGRPPPRSQKRDLGHPNPRCGWVLWSPTLATKTKTSRGWGIRSLVLVHPSQVSEARPGAPAPGTRTRHPHPAPGDDGHTVVESKICCWRVSNIGAPMRSRKALCTTGVFFAEFGQTGISQKTQRCSKSPVLLKMRVFRGHCKQCVFANSRRLRHG
jgi:hypothetical protein